MEALIRVKYNNVTGYGIKNDIAVAYISRVASQAMYASLGNQHGAIEAGRCERRVAFIRDPLARHVSAYRLMKMIYTQGIERVPNQALMSYGAFCEYSVENEDQHWLPQMETLRRYGDLITEHYPLELLLRKWVEFFRLLPPIMNEALVEYPANVRPAGVLELYYAEDIEMRESLRG
jgi:hypothetical protein